MGNKQCKFSQKFHSKYDFIEYLNDAVLGPVKIYRKKQPFYDYLMIVERVVNQEEQASIEKSFKVQQESMFLRLYGHQVIRDGFKNCNKKCKLRMYVEFYNYTLRDLIQHRNLQQNGFSYDEVMYVLKSISKIYYFYQNIQAFDVSSQSKGIFLTPDGQIRFSPLSIFSQIDFHSTQCVQISCGQTKFKKVFRMNDKLIVYTIKKILAQMTQNCNPSLNEHRDVFMLRKQINQCANMKEIEKYFSNSPIDRLQFNQKRTFSSEEQTTKIHKNSSLISNSQFSHSSKLSVKNIVKQQRRQKRPYSHQQHYH